MICEKIFDTKNIILLQIKINYFGDGIFLVVMFIFISIFNLLIVMHFHYYFTIIYMENMHFVRCTVLCMKCVHYGCLTSNPFEC